MSRRRLLAAPMAAVMFAAAPAVAQQPQLPQGETVTATGTGQARVLPDNRQSNASIAAAVDSARKASIGGAMKESHEYALQYAAAAGLKLGSAISVSDVQSNGYFVGPGSFVGLGPFGPNQYCGTVRQVVGRRVKGKKPTFKKVRRCIVPRFAYISLTVTYSAS